MSVCPNDYVMTTTTRKENSSLTLSPVVGCIKCTSSVWNNGNSDILFVVLYLMLWDRQSVHDRYIVCYARLSTFFSSPFLIFRSSSKSNCDYTNIEVELNKSKQKICNASSNIRLGRVFLMHSRYFDWLIWFIQSVYVRCSFYSCICQNRTHKSI